MIICRDWFITFGGAVLLVSKLAIAAEGNSLTFKLIPAEIQPGEHATLEIRLPLTTLATGAKTTEEIFPAVNDDLLRNAKNLKILSLENSRDATHLIWKYGVTGYKNGAVIVPPVNLQVGPANFSTESLTLSVKMHRTPEDVELRPEFGSLRIPVHYGRLILYFLLAFATGLLIFLGRKRLPKLKRPASVFVAPPPAREEDPRQWLKQELARLRQELVADFESSASAPFDGIDELTLILRRYFSRRLKKPVETWTSREFRKMMAQDSIALLLSDIFEQCDNFKFRSEKPSDARELALNWLEQSEKILIHVAIS